MTNFDIFRIENWPSMRYDGRKKIFKGISRDFFKNAVNRHWDRLVARARFQIYGRDIIGECRQRHEDIKAWNDVPYLEDFKGDGMDDFSRFKTQSIDKTRWVAICPGEPANNWYTEDKILCAYLAAKYNKRNK